MRALLSIFVLACGLIPAPAQAAGPATGNWKVTYPAGAGIEIVESIIKLENADGKWTGTLVTSSPNMTRANIAVKSVTLDGDMLRLIINRAGADSSFEGLVKDDKLVRGSYGNDRRITPATLVWTEEDTIDRDSAVIRKELPEPMKLAAQLDTAVMKLRRDIATTKDDDEKKQLGEKLKEKTRELQTEQPKLFLKVVEEHGDTPFALDAAMNLVRSSSKYKLGLPETKKAVATALKAASIYGPRFEKDTLLGIGDVIVQDPRLAEAALEVARKAQATGADTPSNQVRHLTVRALALELLGRGAEAKPIQTQLDAINKRLDAEFINTLPKIEAEPYAGRKTPGERRVLMELFTGAQCPPCVAADVAFDQLHEAYKDSELVLLQYHQHIPGPDPLTNADADARFKHYAKAHPGEVGGTPTTLFDGKPDAGGGGGMPQAAAKFKQFRKVIDKQLEEPAKAAIKLNATRKGDSIAINASITDLVDAGEDKKLRFVLVEDVVQYTGSNGLRLHHHVVRAMPGGADGVSLTEKSAERQATVSMPELRGQLVKYLDDFVRERNPFPRPNRPMQMAHLKVVAFVQDDSNHAVLQSAVVEVK